MSLLDRIVDQKRQDVAELRRVRLPAPPALVPMRLARGQKDPMRLICEFKRRSPSAGELSAALTVEERARAYEECGATMMSVLCDSTFFGGGFEDLQRARGACSLPLLAKEFVIDELQLDAARAYGASAALLIVRCLSDARLRELIAACHERGLEPFVEVVSAEESERALAAGATLIGVNARDLDTLQMDGQKAQQLLEALPRSTTRAHFSGVKSPEMVREISRTGVDAALIGEALMRADDPRPLLLSFTREA